MRKCSIKFKSLILVIFLLILFSLCSSGTTREILWSFGTNGAIASSPRVDEGNLYIGSTDNYLYALRRDNGKLLWKYETEEGIISSPDVSGNNVYIGSTDSNLYALNKNTC